MTAKFDTTHDTRVGLLEIDRKSYDEEPEYTIFQSSVNFNHVGYIWYRAAACASIVYNLHIMGLLKKLLFF